MKKAVAVSILVFWTVSVVMLAATLRARAADIVYAHADKLITAVNGSHTVVLSAKAQYIVSNGVKNYLVYAINDGMPGRRFIFSLTTEECASGSGQIVLAEEKDADHINILDMRAWSATGTAPSDEMGRAVCEVVASGTATEWVEGAATKSGSDGKKQSNGERSASFQRRADDMQRELDRLERVISKLESAQASLATIK